MCTVRLCGYAAEVRVVRSLWWKASRAKSRTRTSAPSSSIRHPSVVTRSQFHSAPILFLALQSHLCSFRLRFSSSCKTFLSCRKSWCFSSCRANSFSCSFRICEGRGEELKTGANGGKSWDRSSAAYLFLGLL